MTEEQKARKRETNKAWYEANKERKREADKAWREANKERKREINKAWHEANKERRREANKAWREANKERRREVAKAWREANRGYKYGLTYEQWHRLLREQTGLCWFCDKPMGGTRDPVVDHVDLPDGSKWVRGLAHHKCNVAAGLMNHDPLIILRMAENIAEKMFMLM